MNEAECKQMTDDEVWEYIEECVSTLKVLSDNNSSKLKDIQQQFKADVALLHKLGRIDEDAYNELNDSNILRFEA